MAEKFLTFCCLSLFFMEKLMRMTKHAFVKIPFVVLCMLLVFMHTTLVSAQPKKPLTLEDFFASSKFAGKAATAK